MLNTELNTETCRSGPGVHAPVGGPPDCAEALPHRPCIGVKPAPEVLWAHPDAAAALEQYRILRTKLAHHQDLPRVIAITSPCMGDGKSLSAVNLAGVLALRKENRTLLVDCDLRRPTVHRMLGIPRSPGLVEVLQGKVTADQAIARIEMLPNLCVLPSGAAPPNAAELLDSPAWRELVETLRHQFDYILFDTPPAIDIADYELIERESDGALMIVRPGKTDRFRCYEAIEKIPPEKLLGVVVNEAQDWLFWKSKSYYSAYLPKPVHGVAV